MARTSRGDSSDFVKGLAVGAVAGHVATRKSSSGDDDGCATGCVVVFVILFLIIGGILFRWQNSNGTPDRRSADGRILLDVRPSGAPRIRRTNLYLNDFTTRMPLDDSFDEFEERVTSWLSTRPATIDMLTWVCASNEATAQRVVDFLIRDFDAPNVTLWPPNGNCDTNFNRLYSWLQ